MSAPDAVVQPPSVVRRLDTAEAAGLVTVVQAFEEMQVVLQCCERLLPALAGGDHTVDSIFVECTWTTALLSYARCFAASDGVAALTAEDVGALDLGEDAPKWHEVVMRLRDHHAAETGNPREEFSVGVVQGDEGEAVGIAITSARQPLVDDVTVRQTGALAYALSSRLNDRIGLRQQEIFEEMKDASRADLDKLELLEVSAPDGSA